MTTSTTINTNPDNTVVSTVYTLPSPTKAQIIERLIKNNHVTIEEAMTLMEKEIQYVPQYIPNSPMFPLYPQWGITYTGKDVVTHI